MVKAVFKRNPFWGILCLFCGMFLIGLFVFIGYKDSEATVGGLLVGIIGGVVICFGSIISLLFNYRAYLYIEDGCIKGRYYWFSKIDCQISDVVFALGRNGTLLIQLKNGKCHTIMDIENSWELGSFIRRNMPFDGTEQPEKLIDELNKLKSAKKKNLIYCCLFWVLMVVTIVVEALLIGEKAVYEFSKNDWIVFVIMGVIQISAIIVTFYFAQKTGKNTTSIEKLKYYIQRTVIEAKPLVYGNILNVFTDDNYTGRITVLGYPNDESVYYIVQEFASDYTLFKSYESEIFENIEQLLDEIGTLVDITEKF